MLNAAALRIMAAKGLTIEDAAEIAEALAVDAAPVSHADEQAERRRAKDRERARVRRQSADSPQTSADPSPQKTNQNNLLPTSLDQNPSPTPLNPPALGLRSEFAEFWASYPSKVAKPYAEQCFAKARRKASFETIMAGLERAKRCRKWLEGIIPNPSTWLNQERWLDEPDETARAPPMTGGMVAAASDELAFRMATGQIHGHSDGNTLGNQGVIGALPAPHARHG